MSFKAQHAWQLDEEFLEWCSEHFGVPKNMVREVMKAGMENTWEAWSAGRRRQAAEMGDARWNDQKGHWETPPVPERERKTSHWTEACPFCGTECEADWCDVGVGFIQSGPFHCMRCLAVERGPHDKDERPTRAGWYLPGEPAGSSANTVCGRPVDHKTAKKLYDLGFLDRKE